MIYEYRWGNNEKRLTMKGRQCKLLAKGKKNSCLIEFLDTGQKELVSQYAIKLRKE